MTTAAGRFGSASSHATVSRRFVGIEALGDCSLSETAEKAIGVREVRRLLAGEIDRETCIDAIQQATRRYAKRQMNWFRREPGFTSICIRASDDADSAVARILESFPDL